MATREPLDHQFPLAEQFGLDGGPAILTILFFMPPDDEAAFLEAWQAVAACLKAQPGFISAQLHRAIGPSPTFLGQSVWESIAAIREAFTVPEFVEKIALYPDAVISRPHLFERVAVPGICVA